jgi:hypothetical protein
VRSSQRTHLSSNIILFRDILVPPETGKKYLDHREIRKTTENVGYAFILKVVWCSQEYPSHKLRNFGKSYRHKAQACFNP